MSPERQRMGVGDTVLLDAVGAVAILMEPDLDFAIILDLEGKLNKLDVRDAHRYAMSMGQAAELVAEIVLAVKVAEGQGAPPEFDDELTAAIRRLSS